ncbi:type II secretion system protein [Robertmurraya sp. GLU-23]
MLKSLKKKMKDQAGLTLIELLVVIVILGIIAAVAVPMVMGNKDKAEINTNKQTLSILKDAVNRYEVEVGSVPADVGALVAGKYLDSAPTCAEDTTKFFTVTNGAISSSCNGVSTPSSDDSDED